MRQLSLLVSADVARGAVDAVKGHIGRLAFQLAPAVDVVLREHEDSFSQLAVTVEWLVAYAQTGALPGDWETTGEVLDALLDVFSACYRPAIGEGASPTDVDDDADERTELGLVVIAALARVRLAQGAALGGRELATLAGVSVKTVQHDAREGRLSLEGPTRGDGRRASAEEARRWLRERKVPGV